MKKVIYSLLAYAVFFGDCAYDGGYGYSGGHSYPSTGYSSSEILDDLQKSQRDQQRQYEQWLDQQQLNQRMWMLEDQVRTLREKPWLFRKP